ncbi:hypothetical protein Cni_G19593 [Canna indica]|uniref:hexokinase n=1 Tax=Canna indica TaxID=4628 RepID=A0AAQ3KMF4_9LILI|nr:hypothetical protein Cni_G19593 [Canna indica]
MHFCRCEGYFSQPKQPWFAGIISPDIGSLTFLRTLNLSHNNLQGHLPSELGCLSHLESLLLWQNSFEGRIPADLANCSNLLRLSLCSNKLTEEIPAELGALRKLLVRSLHDNNISGSIPPSLGNLSSLTHLDHVRNQLSGILPLSLGRLQRLKHISVTRNRLTGEIPSTIFNISFLSHLYLGYNFFSGVLTPDMGNTLVNLEVLQAFRNLLEGPIPISIANDSKLREIVMPYNRLSGTLPGDIGKLRYLSSLSLRNNRLEAKTAEDWEFLNSLANASDEPYLISLSIISSIFYSSCRTVHVQYLIECCLQLCMNKGEVVRTLSNSAKYNLLLLYKVRLLVLSAVMHGKDDVDVANSHSISPFAHRSPTFQVNMRTSLMAAMHDDDSLDMRKVERILEESLQITGFSLKARMLIVRVCDIVTRRAARLAVAGIAGLLKKIGRDGSGGETSGRMNHKPRRTVNCNY